MPELPELPELPEGQKVARAPRKSRRESIEADRGAPAMPPIEWGRYLVDYLLEFGPTMPTGMGSAPLMPSEIEAAQRLLGIELQPWEARLLLRLSREYLAESYRATEQHCSAPWQDPETAEIDQVETARRLEQSMMDLVED